MTDRNTFRFDTAGEVWCPTCGARPGDDCIGLMSFHPARNKERKRLEALATGADSKARWWRWRLRNAGAPRATPPHGTYAGYRRHKRDDTPICAKCQEAAREKWRTEKAAQTARAKEAADV